MYIDKTDCIIITFIIIFSLFKINSIYFADSLKQHTQYFPRLLLGKKLALGELESCRLLQWYNLFVYHLCIMLQSLNHVISTNFYHCTRFTWFVFFCKKKKKTPLFANSSLNIAVPFVQLRCCAFCDVYWLIKHWCQLLIFVIIT